MHPEKLVVLDVVRIITFVEIHGRKVWSYRMSSLRGLEGEWLPLVPSLRGREEEEVVSIVSHYGRFKDLKSYVDFVEKWEAQCLPAWAAAQAAFTPEKEEMGGLGLRQFAVMLWLCRQATGLYDHEMAAAQPGVFEDPDEIFETPEGFPQGSMHWITTPLGLKVEPRPLYITDRYGQYRIG